MSMNRESILEAMKLKTEIVEINGSTVIVSEIGAADLFQTWEDKTLKRKNEKGEEEPDTVKFMSKIVVLSVVDEFGNKLFTDNDMPIISNWPRRNIEKIANKAQELSGAEDAKNSDDSQPELPSIASA